MTEKHLRPRQTAEAYLRDARSHISEIAEAEFGNALDEAESHLSNNALGSAFEVLRSVAEESNWESQRVFELLALAAASIGLEKEQQELDATLSKLKGWIYKTQLPEYPPSGQCMRVLAEESWAWMLFNEGDAYFLSVVCGTVGVFTQDIQLLADEIEKFRESGNEYISLLAKDISASPSSSSSRHIKHFEQLKGVKEATETWRASRA